MNRILDTHEMVVSPSYRLFGLMDMSIEPYGLDPDDTHWLLSAPGLIYLQVPSAVIESAVRLESWSSKPPESHANWFGREEVEVELPTGEIGIHTIDGGVQDIPLILPSAGLYEMRWQWMFNGDRGPFLSPIGGARALPIPPGQEGGLKGKDQYCLVQMWRTLAYT
ncbi:hypothetical protein D3105_18840 [Streptomyces globisporus]|uniref:Uncharacterized protein n=1 Tax=Streptomyces globisporus TaxID=1908 RepID=A0A423UXE7_STRGL|nr:hypothetical protein D3105_18840 [Streptomyces globisporus]